MWTSWWALSLYGLVFLYLLLVAYRYQLKQQLKQQLAVQEQKRLVELDLFKSRLYTNITHEFRTPLTVILGMTDQMKNDLPSGEVRNMKKKLDLIERNGNNLLSLVNQILDLSKIENNQLTIQYSQGDLVSYIKYIAESFTPNANAQNIILRIESQEPKIIMDYDPEKIRHILSNLLSNAIKYTSSSGMVKIEVAIDPPNNPAPSNVIIKVSDTGRGIPDTDLPYIFDRFYQANDTVNKAGGTGIGMALTKELIKFLEGDIQVRSVVDQGTTFTVQLPIHNKAPFEKVEQLISANSLNSIELPDEQVAETANVQALPSLLILEDNMDVVEYLKACLTSHYSLNFAYNGKIGIEKALAEIPDIILSDVLMPEKDGFEVCDTLKNDERTSHIPIVLLTAKADISSRIAGLRRGADAYLAKPFNLEELTVTLHQLIAIRAKLQARYASLQIVAQEKPPKNGVGQSAPSDQATPSEPSTISEPVDQTFSTEQQTNSKQAQFDQSRTLDPFLLDDAFFLKAKSIIEEHLTDSNFSPQVFSRQLGMSYSVLHRKLAALVGLSPSLFIRAIRLQHAKDLLLSSSDSSITEIAYQVGFNDPKFFSRVFSKKFGISPSKFRAQHV